jgi:hypothetical protein
MSKNNAPADAGSTKNAGADPAAARPDRKPSRTVSASGVVVTDGDGDAFLDDQDTNP